MDLKLWVKKKYDSSRFIYNCFFLVCAVLLALATIDEVFAYSKNDFFKTLNVNDASGIACFTITNPLSVNLDLSNLKFTYDERCGHVRGTSILLDNKPLTTLNKSVTGQVCIKADIEDTYCNKTVFGHTIDWKPTVSYLGLNYTMSEWAWWSLNYTQKVNINCSMITGNIPVYLNGSNGLDLGCGSKVIIQAKCEPSLAVFYNNCTSLAVVNATSKVMYDVQLNHALSNNQIGFYSQFANLSFFYPLNEPSGTTTEDVTGHINGTIFNTLVLGNPGKVNNSYRSDGSSTSANYVNQSSNSYTDYTSVATFSFWANLTACPSDPCHFFAKSSGSGTLALGYYTSGKLEFGKDGVDEIQSTGGTNVGSAMNYYTFRSNNSIRYIFKNSILNASGAGAAWTSNVVSAGVMGGNLRKGMVGQMDDAMVWLRPLTNLEIIEQYNNYLGTQGYANVQGTVLNIPTVTLLNRNIGDIDSFNILSTPLILNYSDISGDNDLNFSTSRIFYKTNNTLNDCWAWINGTRMCGWQNKTALSTTSNTSQFQLNELDIYPASYNVNENVTRNTAHAAYPLNTATDWAMFSLLNVSTATQYNFIEAMVQNQSSTSAPLAWWYCNETYAFNQKPSLNANCVQFGSTNASTNYNHSHSAFSSHQIMPFAISNGKVNGVQVTSRSFFLFNPTSSVGWNIFYINVSTRDSWSTNDPAFAISTNNGIGWMLKANETVDGHGHFYNGEDTVRFYSCINDPLNTYCSNITSDLIDTAGLPPTTPNSYSPTMANVGCINRSNNNETTFSISWTESFSPNVYPINYYNVTRFDSNVVPVESMGQVMSPTLTLAVSSLQNEIYNNYFGVFACDILDQCSGYGSLTELLNITNCSVAPLPTTTTTTTSTTTTLANGTISIPNADATMNICPDSLLRLGMYVFAALFVLMMVIFSFIIRGLLFKVLGLCASILLFFVAFNFVPCFPVIGFMMAFISFVFMIIMFTRLFGK